MSRHQFASLKPTRASSVRTAPFNNGNAQSSSSIATPSSAFIAFSIGASMSWRITGWSGPNIAPEAMRKRRE
jgi:hypothetical protein